MPMHIHTKIERNSKIHPEQFSKMADILAMRVPRKPVEWTRAKIPRELAPRAMTDIDVRRLLLTRGCSTSTTGLH